MSVCLVTSLLYFLTSPIGCPTDQQIAVQKSEDQAYQEWRESVERILSASYASCKITAPRPATLNSKERCLIQKLSARCSEADDCLVQCIASGMNGKVGGGCWHLCFDSKFSLPKWSEPKGWADCKYLSTRNGS
jgi:hypothetical protein